eukprot:CAMPEP_0184519558 /NCGR_PEP_ID=MMETSP0198_2-20121128/6694_1 /TAXON_ID=1112570 /ORGANISM="Thraustochytrium sp., Strain LLF1b" /LENGTH=446 /DNA_ID=CAMNT_0026910089 /DNA_START=107 /DNA_END=1447 /DNA_ORIENTATION=+
MHGRESQGRRGKAGASDGSEEEQEVASLGTFADDLNEKRKAKRVKALASLVKAMRGSFDQTSRELDGLLLTLGSNLKGVLKKAKEGEMEQACVVTELAGLYSDENDGRELLDEVEPVLMALANPEAVQPGRSEFAVKALSMLYFLCNEDHEKQQALLKLLEENISGFVPDEVKVAAMRGWGLLATGAPELKNGTWDTMSEKARMMIPLLSHDCLDVKVAAGENLALLLEFRHQREDQHIEEKLSDGSSEQGEQGIVVENASDYVTPSKVAALNSAAHEQAALAAAASAGAPIEEAEEDWLGDLVKTLEDLSHDGGNHSKSKRDLKEQRARFRDILFCVRNGAEPSVKVTIDKVHVELDTWTDIMRLEATKELLGDGFLEHVKSNSALYHILGLSRYGLDAHLMNDRLINLDERSYYSRTDSKSQQVERSKARHLRETRKQAFLTSS